MNMIHYIFWIMLGLAVSLLGGCGIEGVPVSPSNPKQQNKSASILPFDNDITETQQVDNKTSKNYMTIGELESLGYDYNANIGTETNNLQDSFELIKPKSALPRRPVVVPLGNQ